MSEVDNKYKVIKKRKRKKIIKKNFFKKILRYIFHQHVYLEWLKRLVFMQHVLTSRQHSGSYWSRERKEIGIELMWVSPVKKLHKG